MKKRIGVLVVAFVLGVLVVGCGSEGLSVIKSETTEIVYDLSVVTTVGDRSYIPLNIFGNPEDHTRELLLVLQVFEDAHPELEVIGWRIEKQQVARATPAKIFGIWVDHKPRN